MKRIWLVAAENGALKGGKVGGIADVIRELPLALADRGHEVTVFTPAYGIFAKLPEARSLGKVQVSFGGAERSVEAWRIRQGDSPVDFTVFEHPLLTPGGAGIIYYDDGAGAPYATDAARFAFFSAAMAAWIEQSDEQPDVLHLHDWHMGLILALRECDPCLEKLRSLRVVFTIHNLAYQGIRPFRNHASSFESWFPGLQYERESLVDPRYPDCVNPMAVAIRLADKLNTVSPIYAREILLPNNPATGFRGGEGLEQELGKAAAEHRLVGILNGCAYPERAGRKPGWPDLLRAIAANRHLLDSSPGARETLERLPRRKPPNLLTAVGRVSGQKHALFLQATGANRPALESILEEHSGNSVFILLGNGEQALEEQLASIAARHRNFLFLNGYSEQLADMLYRSGDLLLMPSSFEPCGISQMLAMREGQPCVVHAVGGLKDTVIDGENGFCFSGDAPVTQADNFVAAVSHALEVRAKDKARWKAIREHAAAMRFSWEVSAEAYLANLYELHD